MRESEGRGTADAERSAKGGGGGRARVRAAALGAALAALAEPAQGTPGLHASGHDGKARGPSLVSGYPQNESYDASFAASRHAVRRRRGCALGVGSLQGPKGRPR